MSLFGRMYRGETHFDLVGKRRVWLIISASLIAISLLSLAIRGLNLGLDFKGGTIVEAENVSDASISAVRDALAGVGQEGAKVQLLGDGARILVQTEALSGDEQDELVALVAQVSGVPADETNVDAVGPTFGEEITRRALRALVIFLIVVSVFISWRFEWKMAGAALTALFHDLAITAGIYSVIGFEVTPATVIAVLTILGYSLYDTVVVFDKVTENVTELGGKHTFDELANLSMNQVLMRSINTSLTSLLPVGSLLFVGSYLLGAATLREFALALFIGIAVGTYSSIGVATPMLAAWKSREVEWERMERRAARRAGAAKGSTVQRSQPEIVPSGAAPRPPKRRRRG